MRTLIYDLFALEWLRKSSFYIPPAQKNTLVKVLGSNRKVNLFSPLTNRLRFTPISNCSIIVPVVGLFLASSPPTIFRSVVAIIINTVKRVAFWGVTHVSIKSSETGPVRVNGDTPTTVKLVVPPISVVAPLSHVYPSQIRRVSRVNRLIFNGHAVLGVSMYFHGASSISQTKKGVNQYGY